MAYRGTELDNDIIRRWRPPVANQTLRRPEPREGATDGFTQVDGLWVPEAALELDSFLLFSFCVTSSDLFRV